MFIGFISCLIFLSTFNIFGKTTATKQPAKSANAPATLERAKNEFFNYNFTTAYNLFKQAGNLNEEDNWLEKAKIASNAFERVQQIVVIDSISMPRETFFKAFKIPSSAGYVGLPSELGIRINSDYEEVSYLNEDKDYLISPEENEEGELVLVEKRKLLDGSWETINALEGDFEKEGDYAFPFLTADGQNLYFANNGEGSMGGYDLFVVQKEPITGECLQPLNLGMPFNSPHDDLMLVLDEQNGIGWWATDRNSPGEDITIYVYILDEVRKNYPSDTPDLKSLARVNNFRETQVENEEEVEQALLKIKKIR